MAKYSKKAGEKVGQAIEEQKAGELTIGNTNKKVKSRKQAIAIGLSEAKKEGAKVPDKPPTKKSPVKKGGAPKKNPDKDTATKKATLKKAAPDKNSNKGAAKK